MPFGYQEEDEKKHNFPHVRRKVMKEGDGTCLHMYMSSYV